MPLPLSMDRSQELTEKLSEILAKFGEEHGVVVSISSVSFSTPEVIRNFAYVKNGEAVIFGEKARRYGMGEEDYGKRVMVSNKVMRLVDCFPNRHKYPFVVEDGKGKRWKVTAETAKKPAV